ncbi:3-oxoacyl-ACP reductase [Brevibacterium sp. UMB1308A]|uniref:3-oxoacyl-ACP reductase n=1 Tax=Brevibacterium sp. UMB1308A TaxID=3050608 RepID=UPI00254F58B5|nr:3-oxoacyl-ACP reductase [Brevibacterium sp. UMB1308A]MDK8346531.1 3-oxoacyl-ACP reductase [Brevibacterium sp. UMB1308B]MDK8713440.1 3-oxoacyl-ACP reductase [Brevibacterium sp. UMB1308A]
MANAHAHSTSALPISDQIVLITGGARGLGAALTKTFVAEGASVVINYRTSEDAAGELVKSIQGQGGRALAVQADVTDFRAVLAMFKYVQEEWNAPVSTVVNNALVDFSFNGDERPHADEIDYEHFDAQFRGSVGGAVNTIQSALPGFRELGSGRVINIGTNLFQNPVVPYHDYTASKAALLSVTRTFAKDLGPLGVRVNMVSGGLLRTTDASSATPPEVFDAIASTTPLGHVTTPEEFAAAATFFASPASRAVTGQNLVVDNGLVFD